METEREEIVRRLEESRQAALLVDEGKRSAYWWIVSQKIQGWLDTEKENLEILNARLIRTQEDVEDRNDSVKKISMLNQFLNVNETIINERKTVMSALKPEVPIRAARGENFVGNGKTDTNGGA